MTHGNSMAVQGTIHKCSGFAKNCTCPLCGLQDSGGHILGRCTHPKMKKVIAFRPDEAQRVIINAFNKGSQGSHLIADVGTQGVLKELAVH